MSAESTIPAAPAKPERQHSLWESPDRSVAIYLTFEVIDAINQALAQIAAAPPVRGAEIGGFLLGKSESRGRITVWIDHFEPVPCSYPRGASWMLTEEEEDELGEAIARERGTTVVGLFRSHTRKDLFMSEDDMALFSRYFADPASVFLLVKPFTTRPSIGGFFYWEGKSVHRTASYREFPFHRRELGGGDPSPVHVPPPREWVRSEPETAVRNEANEFEAPAFLGEQEPERRPMRPLVKIGVALALITLCVAGYAAYTQYGGHSIERLLARTAPAPAARKANTSADGTLRLTASEGDKNITLTWDRDSPVIAAATRGIVAITEGAFHKTIELGPDELRSGRLVYSRPDAISDTVSFRMQLDTGQGEPFSEAVRFVSRDVVGAAPSAPPVPAAPSVIAPNARFAQTNPTAKHVAAAPLNAPPPPPAIVETNPTALVLPTPSMEAPKVAVVKPEPPKILRPAPRREP